MANLTPEHERYVPGTKLTQKMKIELKHLIEIVGASSIVISLLFLAYQTNQSNRIAIAMAEIETNSNYAGLNEIWIESQELRDAYYKAHSEGGTTNLSLEEQRLLDAYIDRNMNAFYSRLAAYQSGILSSESIGRVYEALDILLSDPVYKQSFESLLINFPGGDSNSIMTYIQEAIE